MEILKYRKEKKKEKAKEGGWEGRGVRGRFDYTGCMGYIRDGYCRNF